MLVLSRTRNQTIVINKNIRVTIVDVRGDKVRVGIEAPRDIEVHREEVFDAIQRELDEKSDSENEGTERQESYVR